MLRVALHRLLAAVPILLGVTTLNFFLIHGAPGDPVLLLAGESDDAATIAELRREHGLDRPLAIQYFDYLRRTLLELDLGDSLLEHRPVAGMIAETLPKTAQLAVAALAIELALGIVLGVLAAVRPGSRRDRAIRLGALVLWSIPAFYLGLLLLFCLAGGVLHILPTSGMVDALHHGSMTPWAKLADRAAHLVLPALTLALGGAASVALFLRAELREVLEQDYIRTARASGLPERRILLRHALPNGILPLITLTGLNIPALLGGAVIVENLFGWPGMGRLATRAALEHDYPVFLAVNLVFAAMVIASSLAADLAYAAADPRVRVE